MKTLLVRPAAAADIEQACRWYDAQRTGLGDEFFHEVQATLAWVSERPEASPILRRQTRRALVSRFPYGVFYRVYAEQIVVVACFHARRDPKHWRRR